MGKLGQDSWTCQEIVGKLGQDSGTVRLVGKLGQDSWTCQDSGEVRSGQWDS